MNPIKNYRDIGAVGALLDEYEKAINELIELIKSVSNTEFSIIVDKDTKDDDCRSIQSILSHVVNAGYTYVIEVRKWKGEVISYREKELLTTIDDYVFALNEMFLYNEKLFEDYPDLQLEENNPDLKINVRWGQRYDVEQLFEHAIVHVLRHRRQIERFKILLKIN